jgi:hypothetical protein
LQLRNENKELKSKEQELLRKLLEKRQSTTSSTSGVTSATTSAGSQSTVPATSMGPMMSIMSPPNTATFSLDDEEKYGLQGTRHLMGIDSSNLSLLAPNKATEGF